MVFAARPVTYFAVKTGAHPPPEPRSFTSLAASAAIFELCWAPTSFQLTTESFGRNCFGVGVDSISSGEL